MNNFIFTCGDINGIGPETALKCLNDIYLPGRRKLFFVCPENVFEFYAGKIKISFPFEMISKLNPGSFNSDKVTVLRIKNKKMIPGIPTAQSGLAAFDSIRTAFELLKNSKRSAIVTAPISKFAFQSAGVKYPGHTELFAEWTGVKNYLMMFVSNKTRMGLVTIHEPVKKISSLITFNRLTSAIKTVINSLKIDFGIISPRIAVLGLNPHAGEGGRIGLEEEQIIKPAVKSFKYKNIEGPFSPDAFFAAEKFKDFDFTLGMYHDQILIPFKFLDFYRGVNFTAGLNIVRTSPDHGTAYDIAGKMIADHRSTLSAFRLANTIINNRNKFSR